MACGDTVPGESPHAVDHWSRRVLSVRAVDARRRISRFRGRAAAERAAPRRRRYASRRRWRIRTSGCPHAASGCTGGTRDTLRTGDLRDPLCVPSRAEILTGCTGFRNGVFPAGKLNADVPLWPRTFRESGYHTWYVGKWHTSGRPSTVGYEEVDGLYASGAVPADQEYVDFRGQPATGYRGWQFQTDDGRKSPERGIGLTPDISGEFADAAIRFLRRKPEKPFFLHVNFTAPHDPLLLPTATRNLYDPALVPLPANFRSEHPFDHGNAHGRDELLFPFPRTPESLCPALAAYYALITDLDAQIGRILQTLQETGEAERTVVIFASDHGLALGSHGLTGKQNMYEHTLNVPLILAGPGIPVGEMRQTQCYLRDLFPTACELAGLPAPSTDGRSLVPALRDGTREIYPFVVGYFADSQRAIRQGSWKLVWYPQIDRWQLFDVGRDPDELADRVDDPLQSERVTELRRNLRNWLQEQGDPRAAQAR